MVQSNQVMPLKQKQTNKQLSGGTKFYLSRGVSLNKINFSTVMNMSLWSYRMIALGFLLIWWHCFSIRENCRSIFSKVLVYFLALYLQVFLFAFIYGFILGYCEGVFVVCHSLNSLSLCKYENFYKRWKKYIMFS